MSYDPQKTTTHVEDGLEQFLEQFKDKPLINALLASYLKRIQKLEDAIWEVILIRGIEESEGVNLDVIGKIVGRPRLGLVDIDYRVALRAQIRINRSSGTPEDLIAVTRLSTAGQSFVYNEAYPATVIIEVLGIPAYDILVLYDNLLRTKAGGVRLILEYALDLTPFTWSDDDTSPADTALGWGDDGNPAIGGEWIGTI